MWNGFTENDIQKLKAGEGLEQTSAVSASKRQATHLLGSGKKNIARERMLQRPKETLDFNVENFDVPENARLSKPRKRSYEQPTQISPKEEVDAMPKMEDKSKSIDMTFVPLIEDIKSSGDTAVNQSTVCIKIKEGKNYEVVSSEKSSLDEFELRQKMMEQQNSRRKELLVKVLADRKKKTRAEARRLQQIQEELQKLDLLLSNEVGILRNQIETASLEFMDAQKRYSKAEKDYLDAKLNLFGKLEKKELLTEHLCKIIEQNEMRKAKKLSELMDQLDLGKCGESQTEEDAAKNFLVSGILPTLCALDEVTYSACNTLKNRLNEPTPSSQSLSEDLDDPCSQPEIDGNSGTCEAVESKLALGQTGDAPTT